MICLSCKNQIPDDSTVCPNCHSSINHQKQVIHEVKIRRYQRWLFYFIIVVFFGSALFYIIKVYSDNNKLIEQIAGTQNALDEAQSRLESKDRELSGIKSELAADRSKLGDMDSSLKTAEDELASILAQKEKIDENSKQCYLDKILAEANVYGLVTKLGQSLSKNDLARIQLADANLSGEDVDKDGLSDTIEGLLGTDPQNPDSDNDGYDDKDELMRGFDPLGAGRLPLDNAFAKRFNNSIVLQNDSKGGAWYVGPDQKKYFLGTSDDGYLLMRQIDFWTKEYLDLISTSTQENAVENDMATSTQ